MLMVLAASLFAAPIPSHSQGWTATWTQKAYPGDIPDGPGGRGWVDLTYDSVNRRIVLMAGSASAYMDDVWWYDGGTDSWTSREPSFGCSQINGFVPPTGRDEYALEYDPVNQLYWMFGGSGFGCVGPNRTAGAGTTTTAVVDSTLTATTVNAYKDWTVQINSAYAYVAGYDSVSKTLTLTTPIPEAVPGAQYRLYPQRGGGTWYYSPASRTWGSLTGPPWGYTGPSPWNRLSPGMVFSSRDNAMVMFGGQGNNDTWALDVVTKRWVQLLPGGAPGSPPARAQLTNSLVYDSANDVFILFGGCLCTGNGGPSAGDTWVYRLSTNTWTNMSPPVSPPARQAHTMVYDSANQVVVLFGGWDVSSGFFNDLWVYSYATNTWTQVFPSVSPPPRWIGAMAYDPVNRLTVLYSGATTVGTVYDNWALNLQRASTPNPVPSLTSLSPSSATAGGPGFTMTVTGASFVSGSAVRWNGANHPTTYVRSTQLQATIPASDVVSAGTAQVTVFTPSPGGGTSNPFPVVMVPSNPVPTLTSLSPGSATAGGPGFFLSLTGTGFGPTSLARWNGSVRTTIFVSSTQLKAIMHSTDIISAGAAQVTVFTPGPGGGTSNALPVTVAASSPVPMQLTSLSPSSATAGGPGFFLTVNGTGFGPTSLARWNGSIRTTIFVSSTQLKAIIHSSDLVSAGAAQVTVFTPGPVSGNTNPLPVTVLASGPLVPGNSVALTSLSPSSATAGGSGFFLTVTGTGFGPASVVRWNGNARTTTYVSSTQLQAIIHSSDILSPGSSAQVSVTADPSSVSNALPFSIR
jgi:hypothetical protein